MMRLWRHLRATLRREHFTLRHVAMWVSLSWLRLRMWWAHVWTNPAPRPDQIGTRKARGMRPIHIEFVFVLYPDGKVAMKSRWGGDERVTDEHLIGLVHREYRLLVNREYARRGLRPPKWTQEFSLTPGAEER